MEGITMKKKNDKNEANNKRSAAKTGRTQSGLSRFVSFLSDDTLHTSYAVYRNFVAVK